MLSLLYLGLFLAFVGCCVLIVSGMRDLRLCDRAMFNGTAIKTFEDKEKFDAIVFIAQLKKFCGWAGFIVIPALVTYIESLSQK